MFRAAALVGDRGGEKGGRHFLPNKALLLESPALRPRPGSPAQVTKPLELTKNNEKRGWFISGRWDRV